MLQFLQTHKRPMSLVIKEAYLALNVFFILTIILATLAYFYLLSANNYFNYKQVKVTLSKKNLLSEHQMLKSQLLDNASLGSVSPEIFANMNLEKPKEIIFILPREEKLKITQNSLAF